MMMGSLEESIVESQTTPTDLPEVQKEILEGRGWGGKDI